MNASQTGTATRPTLGKASAMPARLFDIFQRNAERTLLVDARTEETWTYGRMMDESRVLASVLTEKGVRPGETVVFSMDNCAELAALYFACLHIGARVAPINPSYHPRDYVTIMDNLSARFFFTTPTVYANLRDVLSKRKDGLQLFCMKPGAETPKPSLMGLVNFDYADEVRRGRPCQRTFAQAANDDIAFTMYTSGSTGCPKGINIRLGGLLGNGALFCERMGLDADSRFYNILAMTYLGGLYNLMLIPILAEGSFVLDMVFGPTNMHGFWEMVREHQINTLWFSPTMLSMLLMLEGEEDLSHLKADIRLALCGMAPLPVGLKKRFEERFGFPLYENYGLSETTFVCTSHPALAQKPGSVGLPLDGVSVTVLDNEGRPVPTGHEGQIGVQTPYLMAGYEKSEPIEKTLERNGGYFLTGDLGHLDEDGELFITDRAKDLIIRGGVNISPKAIEDVVYGLQAVQEAAVVGVPHPIYGEEVALVLKLREAWRDRVSIEEVRKFCDANIAFFQRPKLITFIDEIPKGATGKIQKNVLRRMLQEKLDPLNN